MKLLKKLSTVFLAFAIIFSATSCSDKSWAVKIGNEHVAIGVYIYYMSMAYSQAYYKVENPYGEDILSQTIEEKNASDWIQEHTLDSIKKLLFIEKQFADAGLSLTDEENAAAESTTDMQWKQYGKMYEKFGISKSSFHRAVTMFNQKSQKLSEYLYGEGGPNFISDDDLKKYFLENYTDYSYITKSYHDDSDHSHSEDETESEEKNSEDSVDKEESSEDVSNEASSDEKSSENSESSSEASSEDVEEDDELEHTEDEDDKAAKAEEEKIKNEINDKFNAYLELLNNGSDMDSVAKLYMTDYSTEENPLKSEVEKLDDSYSLPEEVVNALKEMENNTSKVVTTDSACYLVHKGDINSKLDKLESDKETILSGLKTSNFEKFIEEGYKTIEITVNDGAIKKYNPSMFAKNTSKK